MNRKEIIFLALPTILLAVFRLIAPTHEFIIPILIIWLVLNIVLLKPKLDVIDQYKQLIKLLGKLSLIDSDGNRVITEAVELPKMPSSCWKKYFIINQKNVDEEFKELNKKINSPYRLLYPNTILIGKEFARIVNDTKTLHEEYTDMVKCGDVFGVDCDTLKTNYKDFFRALKQSRNYYPEIEKAVSDDLLSIPSLPTYQSYYNKEGY